MCKSINLTSEGYYGPGVYDRSPSQQAGPNSSVKVVILSIRMGDRDLEVCPSQCASSLVTDMENNSG